MSLKPKYPVSCRRLNNRQSEEQRELKMAQIELNGQPLEVQDNQMLIQVADAAGVYIPRFCYHEKLSVSANCRMCLVEVEGAPKPLPACATPVTDGMKVKTRSAIARDAQQGTMEFLLINHPLDCPICDQGGECPLQDQAVSYGKDISRYHEEKRAVSSPDIGPLVATAMTRCIHCTRCVRFGEELAGIMEMGAVGRGDHTSIGTYLGETIESELSGNMIDLCPVGALTSKPSRFSARSWELLSHNSIAPHDCLGSNLKVQTLRNKVIRVLSSENERINECWLSDRDRFSFEAISGNNRLMTPMVREQGRWRSVDWHGALEFAVEGLRRVIAKQGAESIGALISASSTLEEAYLCQKLIRGLGSHNVDHRLQQQDFRDDQLDQPPPGLGRSIASLESVKAALLVGSNIRKEQPLLGLRLRKAVLDGAEVASISALDYAFNFSLRFNQVDAPSAMPKKLAEVAAAVAKAKGVAVPEPVQHLLDSNGISGEADEIAEMLLKGGQDGAVILGFGALSHPRAATLKMLAHWISELTGASFGLLDRGNSAGATLAGSLPLHQQSESNPAGLNAKEMVREKLAGYLLFGVEPELDSLEQSAAQEAMVKADFVISINPYSSAGREYADVILPSAAFTETSGTHLNCEHQLQSFEGAVAPPGDARPGWKILRVMANMLDIDGFDFISSEEVLEEVKAGDRGTTGAQLPDWELIAVDKPRVIQDQRLESVNEISPYRLDSTLRRAESLQITRDNQLSKVSMSSPEMERLGIEENRAVVISGIGGRVSLPIISDQRVPAGCIHIPLATEEGQMLGGSSFVTLEID